MTASTIGARSFMFRTLRESLAKYDSMWVRQEIPLGWLRAYAKPIVLLRNGFAEWEIVDLVADGYRYYGQVMRDVVESQIEENYGFRPDLVPVSFEIRKGGFSAWRRGQGHFVAERCPECGDVLPIYRIERETDLRRAQRLEAKHPALPSYALRTVFGEGQELCAACDTVAEGWKETNPWKDEWLEVTRNSIQEAHNGPELSRLENSENVQVVLDRGRALGIIRDDTSTRKASERRAAT